MQSLFCYKTLPAIRFFNFSFVLKYLTAASNEMRVDGASEAPILGMCLPMFLKLLESQQSTFTANTTAAYVTS